MTAHLKAFCFFLLTVAILSACAPRVAVKPIPADTPPEKVVEMITKCAAGIKGLKAAVKVTVQAEGKAAQGFDGVLYAAKPDKVRLTGLAFMGFTAFDMVLSGEKFYFYEPSDGYLYTGPRGSFRRFLAEQGVDADPDVISRSLFIEGLCGPSRYLFENTGDGYNIYRVADTARLEVPEMKVEFDRGLNVRRKVFYDELARPYLTMLFEGTVEEGGVPLPKRIRYADTKSGYTVAVSFEKYIVNPEGLDDDFVIEGGEFKGIREVE